MSNTVGRDNYKYFVGLLLVHPVAYFCFVVTTAFYWRRAAFSVWFYLFLLYSLGMFLMVLGLLNYHVKLLSSNLTTNEDINMVRYQYMRNEFNVLSNPFDRGAAWPNVLDGLFPSTVSYYTRDEVIRDRQQSSGSGSPSAANEEQEGFFEEAKVKLLGGSSSPRLR